MPLGKSSSGAKFRSEREGRGSAGSAMKLTTFTDRKYADEPSMRQQPDHDGWMEAWISCALGVRQRQVNEKEPPSFDQQHCFEVDSLFEAANPGSYDDNNSNQDYDSDKDKNTNWNHSGQPYTTPQHSDFIQRRELTVPSRCPSMVDRGSSKAPLARPWTASAQPYTHATPSTFDRRSDTRGSTPTGRPHSAAGAIGRRSGGVGSAGHMASAGKAWVREIAERVAPRRPGGLRSGPSDVRGDPSCRGGTQKAGGAGGGGGGGGGGVARRRQHQPSRIGQGRYRRAGQTGQVRVLAAWSYEVSKRHGQGCGGTSPSRQILVKVPCVKTSGGGGKKSKRPGDAPYRLAFNDEVKKCTDDHRTRNGSDTAERAAPREADGDAYGCPGGDPDSSESSVDGDGVHATLAATNTPSAALGLAPRSPDRTKAVMVQLPRPPAGEEVSSTTTDGNKRGCSSGAQNSKGCAGHGFGSAGLGSASESSGWQSILEENEHTPSTSRVIAKLRASVARDTRPSSAVSFSPTTASAAAAGSGLLPVPVMEVRLGDGIAEAARGLVAPSTAIAPCLVSRESGARSKTRPRPQSATGLSLAGRTSNRMGSQRPRVPHACGGAMGRVGSNTPTHESADGGTVAAGTPRVAEWHKGGAAGRIDRDHPHTTTWQRPKSAGIVANGRGGRRHRDLATRSDYSFFPSTPAETFAEGCDRSDPETSSVGPFWGGVESQGDVTEWESSLCSSVAEVTSTGGYALDAPGSWRETAGF